MNQKEEYMRSENGVDDELIIRYLTGEATPGEAMALNDWLADAENKLHFEKLEATWNAMHPVTKRSVSKKAAWEKIKEESALVVEKTNQRSLFTISSFSLKIAASLLLFAVSGAVLYVMFWKENTRTIATLDNQEQVTLADNSHVTLYRNTSITFPETFRDDSREVKLVTGEAFFSVAPNKEKPFIIHTTGGDIQVVGTEFNVIAKGDEVQVEVKEGMVLLSNGDDQILLKKGESGIIRPGDEKITTNDGVNMNAWAYATRQFDFRDTPIREVIRDVEKTFGCTISVSNENINKCKLTATFDNDSASKIVNLIAETLNLSLKENGRVFTLEGEGCP